MCFLSTFLENDAGAAFYSFFPFAKKTTTLLENFQILTSGAKSQEWLHQISTNQPYINKENGSQIELIIRNVLRIFHINCWRSNKNFLCRVLKVTGALPEKHIIFLA